MQHSVGVQRVKKTAGENFAFLGSFALLCCRPSARRGPSAALLDSCGVSVVASRGRSPRVSMKFGQPSPRAVGAEDARCYLVFSSASRGSFYLQWSTSHVSDGLACFQTHEPLPTHKTRHNGGRLDLCRDVGGPDRRNFYRGWVSFLKHAIAYRACFVQLGQLEGDGVAIYLLEDATNAVSSLQIGEVTDFTRVRCVAVVPLLSRALEGVYAMDPQVFHQAGEKSRHPLFPYVATPFLPYVKK